MEAIQENWMVWLFCMMLGFLVMQLLAKGRTNDIQPGMATRADEFSMKTTFFNFKSGEASLFFVVIWILGSGFLFSLAFAKNLVSAFPGF